MIYGSVCAGIEAATVAWHPLGWKAAFYSEINKSARTVLQYHYPTVPLHGDFTTIKERQYGSVDVLIGGTPCQSYSIAGKRLGLDDPRGNLTIEFVALGLRTDAQWLVLENVPGLLSSCDDGNGRPAGEDDTELHGECLTLNISEFPKNATDLIITIPIHEQAMRCTGGGTGRGGDGLGNGLGIGKIGDPSPTLLTGDKHGVFHNGIIRKYTPVERERLMGFPDNYTLVDGMTDGQRTRLTGNSMAVPVILWIGERIQAVHTCS